MRSSSWGGIMNYGGSSFLKSWGDCGGGENLKKTFFQFRPNSRWSWSRLSSPTNQIEKSIWQICFSERAGAFYSTGGPLCFPPWELFDPGSYVQVGGEKSHTFSQVSGDPSPLSLTFLMSPPLSLSLPLFSDYPPCLTESPPSPSPTCFAHFTFQ